MEPIPQIPVLDEFGNVIHYANDHKNGTQFLRILDGNLVCFWKVEDAISMDKLNQTHPEIDLDHRIWRLQGGFYVEMEEIKRHKTD